MNKIKLAVIGAGYIAEEHLKVINKIPNLEVDLLISRSMKKVNKLGRKYKIKKKSNNLKDLINSCENIDGILNLVSAENIFDVSKYLVPLKVPIFIEKPPSLKIREAVYLSDLAKKHKTLSMIGFNRRFYSIYQKGLDLINKNGSLLGLNIEGHERFWKIKDNVSEEIRKQWLFANSSHTIDLLNFFGGDIDKISIYKNSLIEQNGDQFSASMKFKSGALGNYSSNWYSPGGWSVSLFGEGITVIFKPLEKGIWIDKNFKQHDILPSKDDVRFKEGFYKQMICFKKLILTKKLNSPGVSIQESLKTMQLIEKFRK